MLLRAYSQNPVVATNLDEPATTKAEEEIESATTSPIQPPLFSQQQAQEVRAGGNDACQPKARSVFAQEALFRKSRYLVRQKQEIEKLEIERQVNQQLQAQKELDRYGNCDFYLFCFRYLICFVSVLSIYLSIFIVEFFLIFSVPSNYKRSNRTPNRNSLSSNSSNKLSRRQPQPSNWPSKRKHSSSRSTPCFTRTCIRSFR
jgi:hypothetical protein